MNNLQDIAATIPYFASREEWVNDADQNVSEIIKAIEKNHKLDTRDYDKFSEKFWRGNVRDTGKHLFDFCKKYISYIVEPEDDQTVKTPGAIIADRYGDCKHYALFINGVCDSLERKGYPVSCRYRFVSDYPNKEVHHVFAVINERSKIGYRNDRAATHYREKIYEFSKKHGIRLVHGYEATARQTIDGTNSNEYWIDPVIGHFDERPIFYNTKDVVMSISRLSGTYNSEIPSVAGADIGRKHSRLEMFVNPFAAPREMINFLRKHGKHPKDFANKNELAKFIMLKHPEGRAHIRRGASQGLIPHSNSATAQRSASGVGKKKKSDGHKNFLQKIKAGAKTNLSNVKKGVVKHLKDVKQLTLKVSIAPARASFLGLVDINAFNLAHRLHDTFKSPQRAALEKKWKQMGGNPKMLLNAVNNGYRQYKKHHGGYVIARDKISGTQCMVHGVGVVQVAALMALATAIIGALQGFIKSSAKEKQDMAQAAQEGAAKITEGAVKEGEGMTDSAPSPGKPSLTTTTGVNAQGEPEIAVHEVAHPILKNPGASGPVATGGGDEEIIPGGGPVSVTDNPEIKPRGGGGFDVGQNVNKMFGGIMDMIAKYKKPLAIAGGVVLVVTVGPRIFTALKGNKKKRR